MIPKSIRRDMLESRSVITVRLFAEFPDGLRGFDRLLAGSSSSLGVRRASARRLRNLWRMVQHFIEQEGLSHGEHIVVEPIW
jgi:hypothetical protein